MKSTLPDTNPPTYTASEVARILRAKVTEQTLVSWDKACIFRPSFYLDRGTKSDLISAEKRDERIQANGRSQGNPRRRYTYNDLVWLRLLLYVKDHLHLGKVPSPARRGAKILATIKEITKGVCPASSRLLFVGTQGAYLLDEHGIVVYLGDGRQLAMRTILTDAIFAEVRGRIAVLEASRDIRSLPGVGNGVG